LLHENLSELESHTATRERTPRRTGRPRKLDFVAAFRDTRHSDVHPFGYWLRAFDVSGGMPVPLNAWLAGAHEAAATKSACDAARRDNPKTPSETEKIC
jgi:hypothetical protein